MRHIHLHFHDAGVFDFDETKVTRGGDPQHPGRFSRGSGSGSGAKPKPRRKAQPRSQPAKRETKPQGKEHLHGDISRHAPLSGSKQTIQDLDELYQKARQDEPAFIQSLRQVAKMVGGDAVFTPPEHAEPGTTLKSRQSAERKLADEYGGDPSQLTDVLRGTIAANSVEQARDAAYQFIRQQRANIVNIKDRIVKPIEGYRDILVKYRTPQGLIAEVQFNGKNMLATKLGEGHQIYERTRDPKTDPNLIPGLKRRAERLYNSAYRADGNGNWSGMGDADIKTEPLFHPYYRLTRGDIQFLAKVLNRRVYSTRSGAWQPDPILHFADLLFPMYKLNDWDVEGLDTLPDKAAARTSSDRE